MSISQSINPTCRSPRNERWSSNWPNALPCTISDQPPASRWRAYIGEASGTQDVADPNRGERNTERRDQHSSTCHLGHVVLRAQRLPREGKESREGDCDSGSAHG